MWFVAEIKIRSLDHAHVHVCLESFINIGDLWRPRSGIIVTMAMTSSTLTLLLLLIILLGLQRGITHLYDLYDQTALYQISTGDVH